MQPMKKKRDLDLPQDSLRFFGHEGGRSPQNVVALGIRHQPRVPGRDHLHALQELSQIGLPVRLDINIILNVLRGEGRKDRALIRRVLLLQVPVFLFIILWKIL